MGYRWEAEPAAGAEIVDDDLVGAGLGRVFDDQGDAELWLTDNFAELADLGVGSVSLFEEDRLVYGPMSLLPE